MLLCDCVITSSLCTLPTVTAVQAQRKFQKPFRRRPRFYDSEESSADIEDESEDSDDEVRHLSMPRPLRSWLQGCLSRPYSMIRFAYRAMHSDALLCTTPDCPALHK